MNSQNEHFNSLALKGIQGARCSSMNITIARKEENKKKKNEY